MRVPFAMSYRLQNSKGEFRWILDRGVPQYSTEGEFLGFYGGCAETPVEAAITRINELRSAFQKMQDFAERLATAEAQALSVCSNGAETLHDKTRRLILEHRVRQHAATEMGKLAADMLVYDRIANGVCLR
jgi:hypothetical protein